MTQNVGRLGVVLGLDTAEFVSGLGKAKKSVLEFTSSAVTTMGVAGVAAFAGMTAKALSFADAISDVASANEIAIASILHLSEGLAMSGGEAKNAGKLLSSFTSQIDSAAQGSKTAQDMFSRIGISLRDIGKMSNEDLFSKTLSSLAKMDNVVERNALAVQVFGKAVKGVDIKALADEMQNGTEEFKKYAEAVAIAGDLHDKLDAKATKTTLMFTNAFLPTLNIIFDEMNKGGGFMETLFDIGSAGFKGLTYAAHEFWSVLKVINAAVNLVGSTVEDVFTGNGMNIGNRLKEYEEFVAQVRKDDKEFAKRLMANPKAKEQARGQAGQKVIDADKEALAKAQQISYEYAQQNYLKFEQLKRQAELNAMTNDERKIAEARYKIQDETSQKIYDINQKIAEERSKAKPSDAVIQKLQEQLIIVQAIGDAYERMTVEEMQAQQAQQREFGYGWEQAFKQYAEDAGNAAKVAKDMFGSMTSNMNTALENFVKTGKLNFKDLAKSIIQDLIAIQLKASAMRMFSSIGGLFGLGGASYSTDYLSAAAGTGGGFGGLKFADGGEPPVGVPSLVGERGAELFVPKTAGTIIPNHQLGSVLGSGTTINYNGAYIENMSAIDTQNATQFLAKNKQAVYSANLSAGRSLPSSR